MSTNRKDLITQMNTASSELFRGKGYISFVDLLIRMGKLSQQDYEAWRNRKVPYLERVITIDRRTAASPACQQHQRRPATESYRLPLLGKREKGSASV